MIIKPIVNSSRRTTNRLREHGPDFIIKKREHPECFNGHEGVLVESQRTFYYMWLLTSEIEIEDE